MSEKNRRKQYHYVYSCEVDVNFRIKIGTLEGKREKPSYRQLIDNPLLKYSGLCKDGCSDMYVSCQVFSDGKPLAFPVQTSYKTFTTRWNWNEWLTIPLKFSDLPRNAVLALTVWDIYGPTKAVPVGGASVTIFGKYGALRQGMHDLRLWPNVEADGSLNSKTPGKIDTTKDQMAKLSKLTKKHRNGHMMKMDWLDRLTFRKIEIINDTEKQLSNLMFLMIEFPSLFHQEFDCSVIYYERDGDNDCRRSTSAEIVTVPDPEILMPNIVEEKHHRLSRGVRSGLCDKDLKPNAETRDQLNVIVNYPSTKSLSSEEEDLVWKFRYYLSSQKKALTKFLKCVKWTAGSSEEKEALQLLCCWQAMDVEDALELLSPAYSYPPVRRYAVTRLKQASDEDLLMYLLQLVQALKYEDYREITSHKIGFMRRDSFGETSSSISNVSRCRTDSSSSELNFSFTHSETNEGSIFNIAEECDLATFLINRASANDTLANYFYWYLKVECEEQGSMVKDNVSTKDIYNAVRRRFNNVLMKGGPEYKHRRSMLLSQQKFVDKLLNVLTTVAQDKQDRKRKIEHLQALLYDTEANKYDFTNFEPMPLPIDPSIKVQGIIPEKVTLFNSKQMPSLLTFRTVDNSEYVTIFKYGDDLRQDQLILQTIMLMDRLLRKENLDLKLTPYCAVATGSKHGFVQFIESTGVGDVLLTEGNIQNFFKKCAPMENGPFGIAPEVMETYVNSCAGYCVITYLLGVGDRHHDNLLLTKTGKLFHIDFGYILGRDPKPLQPPMKMSSKMVEAMGGNSSDFYQQFCKQCHTAFLIFRRNANLILNLFSLMVDATIPDIALEPDKTMKKVQDKFRLDLPDAEAVQYMQKTLDVSTSAVASEIMEHLHKFNQNWRK